MVKTAKIPQKPRSFAIGYSKPVLPLFAAHGMGIIRMLTDMGAEYCGKVETHDYELYLGVSGMEHAKTKAR